MNPTSWVAALSCALLALPAPARGEEIPAEYRDLVKKGLAWLVAQQHRDGHWEGINGQYAVSMTAMAGMALLAEGSTLREGRYRDNLRRAADWLMDRVQANGLIGNASIDSEGGRYMYGHGFGLLFLSCIAGEEDNLRRRERLMDVLGRAARYSRDAQTNRGGWGYLSAKDGRDFDEGSVTITQVQALRAARNAGADVPGEAIRMAQKYLEDSTGPDGGVVYSLYLGGRGPGKPALTAAAICCGFNAGQYQGELVKKWLTFCQAHLGSIVNHAHDEYTQYYYAQVIYVLGEDRYRKLFPKAKDDEALTWSKYRKALFDEYRRTQSADGSWSKESWTAQRVGPVYVTACYLTVLQLDKGALPIYQR
jgi:hypothetical protein